MDELRLKFGDVSLEVHRLASSGPLVCLLPGLGGGVRRLIALGRRLADDGYQPVAIQPRGAGASTGPLEGLTMQTIADDVAAVIQHFGGPATVIGFSFGNRVARFLAADRDDLVAAVVLICAGGEVPPDPDAFAAMQSLESLSSDAERLAVAEEAFFASGNRAPADFFDPGRTSAAVEAQMSAMRTETPVEWRPAGSVPMLVVQGLDDRIAPPENGHRLLARWPDRVEVVDVPRAGHAILEEQPEAAADAVLAFLARQG